MIIKDINIKTDDHFVKIKANCKIRRFGYDQVYFKVDKKYKNFVYQDASPFAAALLIPSMRQGEDLIIKGSVSKKLYNGMKSIRDIFLSWNLGLKPIDIKADALAIDNREPKKIASFFSGGVDSFYTYLKHKKDLKKIEFFILINGFDINLTNNKLWLATLGNISQLATEEKIELITIESNIRPLIDPIFPWNLTHGGCLTAAGLLLRGSISKIFIPSSLTKEQQDPWGSNLETDKLWSTEKLEFIHDGVEASRVNKASQIAKSEIVLKHLRVCYSNKESTYNCGNCEKCMRTMISLQIAGALDKTKTFSDNTINLGRLSKLKIMKDNLFFDEENLAELKRKNIYPELQRALKKCIRSNKTNNHRTGLRSTIADSILLKIIYLDHIYTKGKMNKVAKAILKQTRRYI